MGTCPTHEHSGGPGRTLAGLQTLGEQGLDGNALKFSSQGQTKDSSMIQQAKDLSPDQRIAIESLLGVSIGENEEIVIRTTDSRSAPEWLRRILGECTRARGGPTVLGRD
jgi:hypothetical protein